MRHSCWLPTWTAAVYWIYESQNSMAWSIIQIIKPGSGFVWADISGSAQARIVDTFKAFTLSQMKLWHHHGVTVVAVNNYSPASQNLPQIVIHCYYITLTQLTHSYLNWVAGITLQILSCAVQSHWLLRFNYYLALRPHQKLQQFGLDHPINCYH